MTSPIVLEKPILVSASRAREYLDIGVTKFWAMLKCGRIKMADTGGRRMVIFSSLEALANSDGAASK